MAILLGLFEDVITKTIEYCLFDVVVEFHRCVFLSYLKVVVALKITCLCLIGVDEDLKNLVQCVIYKLMGLDAHIGYHLKELHYCAQCLIIENEDFVKRLRSAYTLGV